MIKKNKDGNNVVSFAQEIFDLKDGRMIELSGEVELYEKDYGDGGASKRGEVEVFHFLLEGQPVSFYGLPMDLRQEVERYLIDVAWSLFDGGNSGS